MKRKDLFTSPYLGWGLKLKIIWAKQVKLVKERDATHLCSAGQVVVYLKQDSPAATLLPAHHPLPVIPLMILAAPQPVVSGGSPQKTPPYPVLPPWRGPGSATAVHLLPRNLSSQLTTSIASLRNKQTQPPSAFTPSGLFPLDFKPLSGLYH